MTTLREQPDLEALIETFNTYCARMGVELIPAAEVREMLHEQLFTRGRFEAAREGIMFFEELTTLVSEHMQSFLAGRRLDAFGPSPDEVGLLGAIEAALFIDEPSY